MKIYAVKPDPKFRFIFPEDSVYLSEDWEFKCKSKAGIIPLNFKAYLSDKKEEPIPDIAWIGMSTFAFKEKVVAELVDILEESGELLPFTIDGEQWYCYNVLSKTDNGIDHEKSKYEIDDGEMRFGLKEPAFILDNLPDTSLFKIKEDNYTMMYCIDNRESDDDVLGNFFCAVAAHGFTGLIFEENGSVFGNYANRQKDELPDDEEFTPDGRRPRR